MLSDTRIVERVPSGALLHCNVCAKDKPATVFGVYKANNIGRRHATYSTRCLACEAVRNSMIVTVNGRRVVPSLDEVRGAVGRGITIERQRASGRPDFMKDSTGILYVDLPASPNVSPQRPKARREAKERALIERMIPRVNAILGPNDIAEAKATCGRQAICTAVGQLLMRRFETGKGQMFIVLPEQPSKKDADFLRHHDITLIVEGS